MPDAPRNPGIAAFVAFVIPTILGAGAGALIGATREGSGRFLEPTWAIMTEQPLENADKAFNWLLFAIFVAAGCVAAAAAWAGSTIALAVDEQGAATRAATSTWAKGLDAVAKGTTPPPPPPSRLAPRVGDPIDPPYL